MRKHFSAVVATIAALVVTGTLGVFLAIGGSSAADASNRTSGCHPGPTANCAGADLVGANLSHLNLTNSNFSHADLSGADLSSANLSGANLKGADLGDADVTDALLKGTNLSGANFMGADLSGATNSNLDEASASSTQYVVCHTILPSGRLPQKDC